MCANFLSARLTRIIDQLICSKQHHGVDNKTANRFGHIYQEGKWLEDVFCFKFFGVSWWNGGPRAYTNYMQLQ